MAEVKDAWSTHHRRARKAKIKDLEKEGGVFACEDCGKGPDDYPQSDQFWLDHPDARTTLHLADPALRVPNLRLEVDHADKDIENIQPENLALLCNSCHKLRDNKTGVGQAQEGSDKDVHGYALPILGDEGFSDPNYTDPTVVHERKSGRKAKVEEFLEDVKDGLDSGL